MDRIRVLIVDDSRLFRSAVEAALSDQPDLKVVGSVFSGHKALEFLQTSTVDIVTLDVEMPGLDGLQTLTAIEQLNGRQPKMQRIGVIMLSAFTQRGADVTVKALEAGAFDFVAKPSAESPEAALERLQNELLPKIRAYAAQRARTAGAVASRPSAPAASRIDSTGRARPAKPFHLRGICIASSTGGPRALATLLPDLCRITTAPILIVQHMPAGFTRSLAESLGRQAGRPVKEAQAGDTVTTGGIYVAPGGRHLLLRREATGRLTLDCSDQPPEEGCRPSANVLFRTAAAALRDEVVALVLTGMGRDGTTGLGPIKRAGGLVIAQDEESSVVWGMPRSAIEAGLVDYVLPLTEMAATVQSLTNKTVAPESSGT